MTTTFSVLTMEYAGFTKQQRLNTLHKKKSILGALKERNQMVARHYGIKWLRVITTKFVTLRRSGTSMQSRFHVKVLAQAALLSSAHAVSTSCS